MVAAPGVRGTVAIDLVAPRPLVRAGSFVARLQQDAALCGEWELVVVRGWEVVVFTGDSRWERNFVVLLEEGFFGLRDDEIVFLSGGEAGGGEEHGDENARHFL